MCVPILYYFLKLSFVLYVPVLCCHLKLRSVVCILCSDAVLLSDATLCVDLQAVAGLLADARSLSEVAREEASNFRSNYGYQVPLKVK